MPKRTDIKSILILGAGPIVIGQACEFDYSGAQACKALREEGYRVILVNSNPATIMTDPEMADATYIEPIHWEVVRKIIEKERPDAVLPTMGGQTALNCALELERQGVLEEFGVTMIGATADAIDKAEDRRRFDVAMKKIGLETARSGIAHTMEEALELANDTQYGLGAGVWSRNGNLAYKMGRGIQAGRVWTNCYHAYPAHAAFGGYKQSGIGRETHKMMLEHYQQTKCLLVSYSDKPLGLF